MNQYTLAVHFQYMNDDGKLAKELFNSGKPFIASIVPNLLDKSMKTEEGEDIFNRIHPPNNYYPGWAKEIFKENWNKPNIIWAQEGYRHCCGRCFNQKEENRKAGKGNYPDPYHEHICLDGNTQSLEKQIDIISKGKELIKKELGINPILYCPPNHLFNKDTLEATNNKFVGFLTRNGFDYFIPGMIKLPVYYDEELFIFPETKKGKSPIIMTYYNHICEGKVPNWREFFLDSSYPYSVNWSPKSIFKTWINEKLILAAKKMRDKRH